MAKSRLIEGVGPTLVLPSYSDDKYYSVKLKSTAEYPIGSRRYISPGVYVELRGKVASAIKEHIESAVLINEPKPVDREPRSKTNLLKVK